MTESTPYKCVNCFLGLTSMQTWKFAHASPLCVRCYDSLVVQKRAKQPDALIEPPHYFMTQPSVLPETLPAGVRTLAMGNDVRVYKSWVLSTLNPLGYYVGRWHGGDGYSYTAIAASAVDWASVPAQEANPAALPSMPMPWRDFDWAATRAMVQRAFSQTQEQANADVAAVLAYEATLKPATCRDCSAPATNYRCKYCEHRAECEPIGDDAHSSIENREARARMLAADERERPRESKESKMLALPHPWRSWSTSGDES